MVLVISGAIIAWYFRSPLHLGIAIATVWLFYMEFALYINTSVWDTVCSLSLGFGCL
jgi:hypothetical protein